MKILSEDVLPEELWQLRHGDSFRVASAESRILAHDAALRAALAAAQEREAAMRALCGEAADAVDSYSDAVGWLRSIGPELLSRLRAAAQPQAGAGERGRDGGGA